jgi:hypothetical protein
MATHNCSTNYPIQATYWYVELIQPFYKASSCRQLVTINNKYTMSTNDKKPSHFSNPQSEGSSCYGDDQDDNNSNGSNVCGDDDSEDAAAAHHRQTQSNLLASSTASTTTENTSMIENTSMTSEYTSMTSADCFAVAVRLHPHRLQAYVRKYYISFDFPVQVR